MTPRFQFMAGLGCVLLMVSNVSAEETAAVSGRPKTVQQLILELGVKTKEVKQVRLSIEGSVVAVDYGQLPKSMKIDLRYDEGTNEVLMVNDSIYPDDEHRRVTTFSDQKRASTWTESVLPEGGEEVLLSARPIDPGATLPNPWVLPLQLGFSAMFVDALNGYEALAKEYSRSVILNQEADARGLVWFELRPSPVASRGMRREFDRGMKLKVGFSEKEGWIEEIEIGFPKPPAVMKMRIVDRSVELASGEKVSFGVPEAVTELMKRRKPVGPVDDKSRASKSGPNLIPMPAREPAREPESVPK